MIQVNEIVISGDVGIKGAQIMAIDALEITVQEHMKALKVFPDVPIFGAANSKHFCFGDHKVEVSLISMPDKIKAVIKVDFNG